MRYQGRDNLKAASEQLGHRGTAVTATHYMKRAAGSAGLPGGPRGVRRLRCARPSMPKPSCARQLPARPPPRPQRRCATRATG